MADDKPPKATPAEVKAERDRRARIEAKKDRQAVDGANYTTARRFLGRKRG